MGVSSPRKHATHKPVDDPWRLNEAARKRRIRDDGRRSLAVNLAEGLALSDFMARFRGAARK